MSNSQPYPAPPIIDAIVELSLKSPMGGREVSQVAKAFASGYKNSNQNDEVDVEVRFEGGSVHPTISQPRPVHILSNADQTDFSRVEVSKLHWSRLPPYEGWEPFEARIFRDLSRIPKKYGFPVLERIGVRFRNRIDVPIGDDNIGRYEDYLSVNIAAPPLLDPVVLERRSVRGRRRPSCLEQSPCFWMSMSLRSQICRTIRKRWPRCWVP